MRSLIFHLTNLYSHLLRKTLAVWVGIRILKLVSSCRFRAVFSCEPCLFWVRLLEATLSNSRPANQLSVCLFFFDVKLQVSSVFYPFLHVQPRIGSPITGAFTLLWSDFMTRCYCSSPVGNVRYCMKHRKMCQTCCYSQLFFIGG